MGMGGQGTGSSVGAILGGIAGTFLLPGVGTALGATLGGGIGSLIGGAVDSGGENDPRGKTDVTNPAATKAEPMNRTRFTPPPSYRHGVEPEFSFFSKFQEGGPVLPLPEFNKPINSAGSTSMEQYFPNYSPTGPGTNGSPSWAQIAASTAPTLPPLRTGVPSQLATPFDPLTYGRTSATFPTPTPPAPQPQPAPPQAATQQYPWPAIFGDVGADFYNGVWNPRPVQGAFSGFGPGYSGSYGGYGVAGLADNGGIGGMTGAGGIGFGGVDTGTYAEGGAVRYQEGGAILGQPAPMMPGAGDSELADPATIYQQAIVALQGRHPNPEPVLEAFIKIFGPAALNRLRLEIAAGIAGQVDDNPALQGGVSPQMSDGMSDSVPATVNGTQPARLSEGEFVVDAPTVAALGNGSTEAGIRQLEGMRQRIRQQAHGTAQQQNKVNPMAALPR